jgi:plasmid segregation protein ParM
MSERVKKLISVIDLGNYNVKGINQEGTQINFKSNISRNYETFPDGFSYVLMDGEYTYFEKGVFSKEYIKTNKDYTAQLLYAIAKLHEEVENIETNLTLLLPISEMEHKQKYIDDLKGKEFKYTVKTSKKIDKTVKINDVLVIPEGYASYFTLQDNIKTSSVLLIDVGGRTSNVVAMNSGKPQVLNTYKIGVLNFYSKLKKLNEDKEYNLEDVERLITKGDIEVTQKQLASFANDIINEIKIDVNLNHYDNVIWTGGGSTIIKDIIERNLPESCTINAEPLYSNILGALEVSKITWGKNNE